MPVKNEKIHTHYEEVDGHGRDVYHTTIADLPSLEDKCVAITGCTSGVGYWAALAMAEKGAKCLILLNRPSERADAAVKMVQEASTPNCEVLFIPCDLTDFDSVKEAAKKVKVKASECGGLDALGLNAAVMAVPDVRTKNGASERRLNVVCPGIVSV